VSTETRTPEASSVQLTPQAVAPFEATLAAVPDAGTQGYERILQAIADAQSVEDLDAPWRSQGMEAYLGRDLVIRSIQKMPSSYEGGIPWFLVVDAVDEETGQAVTFTTGAINVVAQLVQAFALGGFPLKVTPAESERESAAGGRPQHLVIRK